MQLLEERIKFLPGKKALQIWSDQSDVPFDRLDHIVHLSAPQLLGHAKSETFGCVERNMRGQRKRKRIDYRVDDNGSAFVSEGFSEPIPNVAGFFDADTLCAH